MSFNLSKFMKQSNINDSYGTEGDSYEDYTFYHGSLQNLDVGDILVPGSECEKGDCMDEVYLTTELSIAQQFATWDGWIYMVQPIGEVMPDVRDDNGKPITFTCSAAKIIAVVW